MAKEKQPEKAAPEQQKAAYLDDPTYISGSDFQVEGQPGPGLRLYQLSPHKKKWMNQAEAQSLGYYWK